MGTILIEAAPAVALHGRQPASAAASEDGRLRAATYALLAALQSGPPSQDLIDSLYHIAPPAGGDPGSMGQAWQRLRQAAAAAELEALDSEYHELYIGLGRGQVVPYGSWHITGFLMEKPLSELRDDLRALGIEAGEGVKDPEDHIAALCESMALIIGAEDIEAAWERRFFMRHLQPWAGKFFAELQNARSADFYRSVGFFGQRFVELENQYLNIHTH